MSRREHRTTCKNGHDLTPENTYLRPNGLTDCRTCRTEAVQRHRLQKTNICSTCKGTGWYTVPEGNDDMDFEPCGDCDTLDRQKAERVASAEAKTN